MSWYGLLLLLCLILLWIPELGLIWFGITFMLDITLDPRVWSGLVLSGMVWYCLVWFGIAWYNMAWYGEGAQGGSKFHLITTQAPAQPI